MKRNRTPALAVGALLFFCPALMAGAATGLDLALDRFARGEWSACRREALRAALTAPTQTLARVLADSAGLRLQSTNAAALTRDLELAVEETTAPADTRALAAYEAGCARRKARNFQAAFGDFRNSLFLAADTELFARSGAALLALRREQPGVGSADSALTTLLDSLASALPPALLREDAAPQGAWMHRPVDWVVAFYRAQIGPAIGSRCSLQPSCSAYCLEAGREHGSLWALPLTADRLVREPGVVSAARQPVTVGGQVRYADALSDHDSILRRGEETEVGSQKSEVGSQKSGVSSQESE